MQAVAHNPDFAKKVGVSQSVGREFAAADKRLAERSESGVVSAKRETRLGDAFEKPMRKKLKNRP